MSKKYYENEPDDELEALWPPDSINVGDTVEVVNSYNEETDTCTYTTAKVVKVVMGIEHILIQHPDGAQEWIEDCEALNIDSDDSIRYGGPSWSDDEKPFFTKREE